MVLIEKVDLKHEDRGDWTAKENLKYQKLE